MTQAINTKIPNRHGLNIAILVEIPENPAGLIFIVHGFMGTKEAIHIETLRTVSLQHDLTVVRFDATHSFGQSEGSNQGTITTYTHDLEDVIQWAQTQTWYREPFMLAGHSLGGIAILEASQTYPTKIKALAPLATVISGEMDHQAYVALDPDGYVEWKKTGFKDWSSRQDPARSIHIPFSHMENRNGYNALNYAPGISAPVFMIVGDEDQYCPPANQRQLYDALGSAEKEYHIIPNAPHSFKTEQHLQQLSQLFSDWLKKVLITR